MYNFKKLIQSDIEKIEKEAHFTLDQYQIFQYLINPEYCVTFGDTFVCTRLNFSPAKFYRIKAQVVQKVRRIVPEPETKTIET